MSVNACLSSFIGNTKKDKRRGAHRVGDDGEVDAANVGKKKKHACRCDPTSIKGE